MTGPLHVFMPYGEQGGSARVRVYQWLRRARELDAVIHPWAGLNRAGADTLLRHPVRVAGAEIRLRRVAKTPLDRILVHREVTPLSVGGLEERLMRRADWSVLDLDDAMQWDWGGSSRLRQWLPKAPKLVRAVRAADRVVAGNSVLADWASRWCEETVVIPSCVEPSDYRTKTSYEITGPPRLGWIGSPATERHLLLIERPLLELHRRVGARIELISSGSRSLGPLDPMIDRREWRQGLAETRAATWDLGVMPLPDGLYERGKCGYKLLQYGAAALPALASPVGVNRVILEAMGAPAPTSEDEWTDALIELVNVHPVERRRQLGLAGRAVVAAEYSYGAWSDRWLSAMRSRALDVRAQV